MFLLISWNVVSDVLIISEGSRTIFRYLLRINLYPPIKKYCRASGIYNFLLSYSLSLHRRFVDEIPA